MYAHNVLKKAICKTCWIRNRKNGQIKLGLFLSKISIKYYIIVFENNKYQNNDDIDY